MSNLRPEFDLVEIQSLSDEILGQAQKIIGYTFANPELLRIALTHPSATKEGAFPDSYERMEFLGDSVLGCIVAEELYRKYPTLDEGGLTRIKVSLVSGAALSEVALELGINEVIIFGASETGTQGRGLVSALENVYEAIVAAIFLDGGIDAVRKWILRTLGPRISLDMANKKESPKSLLQEHMQAKGTLPTYEIIKEEGPPHDRTFTAEVRAGDEAIGQGQGASKKEAETAAAQDALNR